MRASRQSLNIEAECTRGRFSQILTANDSGTPLTLAGCSPAMRHPASSRRCRRAAGCLYRFRRRELADFAACLDLQRSVMNVETMRQLLADMMQERVVMAAWAHQMRGQRGLVGADGPDMQVMHLDHAVERAEILLNVGKLDPLRHRVEREVDTVAGQPPAACEHDGG